ncbi:glycohydrolase toxin TNT-related protein [Mycobacterium sp. BMJ-28]
MTPTKTLVLDTNPQHVLDLMDDWKKAFTTLEIHTETYKGHVERPGGSYWEGATAEAAQARAGQDYSAVSAARDAVDTASQKIANIVSSQLMPALSNAQRIIANAESYEGVTVNEDLSITYDPPEGTSEQTAAKNHQAIRDAADELKASAEKWWTAEQTTAEQINEMQNAVAEHINFASAFTDIMQVIARATGQPDPAPEQPVSKTSGTTDLPTGAPTWQDMILPPGTTADTPPLATTSPSPLDALLGEGKTTRPDQPATLDDAMNVVAPGLNIALDQRRLRVLSQVPSAQELKADPKVVDAARAMLTAQGVPAEAMDAAIDRFLDSGHRLAEHLATTPNSVEPTGIASVWDPSFSDFYGERLSDIKDGLEQTVANLTGLGGPDSPGVVESWKGMVAGAFDNPMVDPLGYEERHPDEPPLPRNKEEWAHAAADLTVTAGSAALGPEAITARGALTHEFLDIPATAVKPTTALDDLAGAGHPPTHPNHGDVSSHTPTPDAPTQHVAAPPAVNSGPHPLPLDTPLFDNYQPTPPGPEFTKPDGSLVYPDDSLPSKPYAIQGTVIPNAELPQGATLDRFGYPGGSWVSPEGVPFAERALPPGSSEKPYFTYEVNNQVGLPPGWRIEQSQAAPWFHQPGGGTQYRILDDAGNNGSVEELVRWGYLREVKY